MKYITNIPFYLFILITIFNLQAKAQKFTTIPTQHLELYQLLGYKDNYKIDTVKTFEISSFITYKEYKEYLKSIKSDSSKLLYNSQLPDSNITINKEAYQKYITSNEFDNFPVLGISWDNAMNYCKWKTLKDNKKEKVEFIYRLPQESEWLATINYYRLNKIKHDLDEKYSDWLLNSFDESAYNFYTNLPEYDYSYFHKKEDPPVLKRKKVVGESYLYNIPSDGYPSFRYGYSYIGYQQISFRIVKTKMDESILEYWGVNK